VNAAEIGEDLGTNLDNKEAILDAARRVQEGGPARVIVSDGARGAGLAGSRGTGWVTPPIITVASSIGAGDSLLAGFCARTFGLAETTQSLASQLDALAFAVATGSADARTAAPGDVDPDVVAHLATQVTEEAWPRLE
jgi:1-phosphofructokinase